MAPIPKPSPSSLDGPQHSRDAATLHPSTASEDSSNVTTTEEPTLEEMPTTAPPSTPRKDTRGGDVLSTATPHTPQLSTAINIPRDLDVMNPTTPLKDQTEENPSAPRRARVSSRSLPAAVSTPSPIDKTSQRTWRYVEGSTGCQGVGDVGLVTAPKRPRSATPPSAGPSSDSAASAGLSSESVVVRAMQREFVFRNLIRGLKIALKEVLENCGMILGSRGPFRMRFEPDVGHIRSEAMKPTSSLETIADDVERAMLEAWTQRYVRFVNKYYNEMRRDLVSEARLKTSVVKRSILDRAAEVSDNAPYLPRDPYPSSPPQTPTPTPSLSSPGSVEALRPRIARMYIGDRLDDDFDFGDDDDDDDNDDDNDNDDDEDYEYDSDGDIDLTFNVRISTDRSRNRNRNRNNRTRSRNTSRNTSRAPTPTTRSATRTTTTTNNNTNTAPITPTTTRRAPRATPTGPGTPASAKRVRFAEPRPRPRQSLTTPRRRLRYNLRSRSGGGTVARAPSLIRRQEPPPQLRLPSFAPRLVLDGAAGQAGRAGRAVVGQIGRYPVVMPGATGSGGGGGAAASAGSGGNAEEGGEVKAASDDSDDVFKPGR